MPLLQYFLLKEEATVHKLTLAIQLHARQIKQIVKRPQAQRGTS